MAFETIRGESGVDFIGTDGVDVLFAINETGAVTVDAKGGNDSVNISSATSVVGTVTIKGGAGNDVITASTAGAVTGNARFSNSDVKGGAGNDTITSTGAVNTKLRGNEGNDNFALEGNYTSSTLNGNAGVDSFSLGGVITLSNTKIQGGKDSDGSMVFDGAVAGTANDIAAAVDSTINGSKGVDNITIGNVGSATNFTVFGGQDGDVITSVNDNADGITYSGDKGDDTINTAGGAAKVTIEGGDGEDILTGGADTDSIKGDAGNDIINGGAGNDTLMGGEGNDTFANAAGDDSLTGGAGADTFTAAGAASTAKNRYIYSAISDSAAAISGSTVTFDTFTTGATFGANAAIVDLTAIDDILVGDTINSTAANAATAGGAITGVTTSTFAGLRDALNASGELTASGDVGAVTDTLSVQSFVVTDDGATGDISGTYIIVNNANSVLDSGDLMFKTFAAANSVTAADMILAIEQAYA